MREPQAHRRVDILPRREAALVQPDRVEQVRDQQPVHDEARLVARSHARLAQDVAPEGPDERERLLAGVLRWRELEQGYHRRRIEVVHPDDPVGPSARGPELADRIDEVLDARTTSGRVSSPSRAKIAALAPRLGRRLDHEVHVGEGAEVRRRVDPAERSLGRGRVELPALDRLADRPLDAAAARRHQLVRSLDEGHAETGARAHLDDAGAHEACADHADMPDVRCLHQPRIGDPATASRRPGPARDTG